jgi:vitamin-K-epoxide reductase (warfarin-sensitive)
MPAAMNAALQRLFSLTAILAVCGVAVSSVSLQHHYAKSKTAYCDIGNTFNCDIVNRSEYSEVLGIPVAMIGMAGYGAIVVLATMYRERRESPILIFAGAVAGLAFALYLTYIEARVLGVWCIVCLSSLVIISVLAIVSGALWFRNRRGNL